MRLLSEEIPYWVWSAHGPTDSGLYYGRTFINGMIQCPIPGDAAQEMESFGYTIEEYVPGTWFSHWEKDPGSHRQRPVFKPIAVFPPHEAPAELPAEWAGFFAMYTNGGKLKKEHRKQSLTAALGIDGS